MNVTTAETGGRFRELVPELWNRYNGYLSEKRAYDDEVSDSDSE